MSTHGKRRTRLADWMVGLAALGILVSIGVPNYLGMEKRLRRESLVSQASLAGAELYRWIHASLDGKATAVAQSRGRNASPPAVRKIRSS